VPPVVVTLVGVGEATGTLDVVMVRAAEALERRRTLRSQLLTALTYPAIVVVLSIGVTAYMMVGLMPKLVKFLAGFGRTLPPLTQFLVDVSNWTQAHLVHLIVALVVFIALVITVWTWTPARLVVDRWLLRVPVIGDLLSAATTSAFARNLGLLVRSGVRITDSLAVVAPVLPNTHVAREVRRVRERVLTGAGLAGPLAATKAFPPILVNMVAVGEASGSLDDVLEQTADFHDERLSALIKRFGTLIEPAIILVLGGLVGFIYLAFFLAIYAIAPGAS
jgi:type IV pilus assembly protein PilC